MEIKRWSGGSTHYNPKVTMYPADKEHNHINNWASDCCGIRRDNAVNPIVPPENSWLGVRVYLDGYIGNAGAQNKVLNLTTKAGPIGVVLTQDVLYRSTSDSNVDPCCESDSGDMWDDQEEDFPEEENV